ncbi:nucleotidyltransferase family protein [Panacibacter ginsenosidivorans]|uniref:Nucleotidyltransferase family protein n=1 Tax=Panacibacter ginsenosidivorans TaxID=1813871 RepID=A0A5B8VAL9_9BACT|nr:sugar phosphate nucleotidyltransferase [Panacibacter ginsenosidivorans]QEC68540.1 nucleotidyltransferase family protein [Panacibacter ginsenosidivorans]
MKGMILAAGLGTRLKPWTDKHPKALAIVNSKSLLQRNVEYLQQNNIYDVIVNVHHFADQIINAIEENKGWGSNIIISDETDVVLETGGGLKKAGPYLKDSKSFVLINCDILTDLDLSKLTNYHNQQDSLATLAVTNRKTSRYFLFNDNGELCGWRNTTTGEERISKSADSYYQKAFSGIHVLSNRIFDVMQQQGKFSMVDVYLSLAATETIKCFDHSESKFIDVGKPESILKAEELFA